MQYFHCLCEDIFYFGQFFSTQSNLINHNRIKIHTALLHSFTAKVFIYWTKIDSLYIINNYYAFTIYKKMEGINANCDKNACFCLSPVLLNLLPKMKVVLYVAACCCWHIKLHEFRTERGRDYSLSILWKAYAKSNQEIGNFLNRKQTSFLREKKRIGKTKKTVNFVYIKRITPLI